ncbi:MAG: hypothetical protein ACMUIE_10285 [Thermoplasmatota archaeon]
MRALPKVAKGSLVESKVFKKRLFLIFLSQVLLVIGFTISMIIII